MADPNANEVVESSIVSELEQVVEILLTPSNTQILRKLTVAYNEFETHLAQFQNCLTLLSPAQLEILTMQNLLQSNHLFEIFQSTRMDAKAGVIERLYATEMHKSDGSSPKALASFM